MSKRLLSNIIMAVSIVMIVIGIAGAAPHIYGYLQGDSTYKNMEQFVKDESIEETTTIEQETGNHAGEDANAKKEEQTTKKELTPVVNHWPSVDFSALSNINSDVKAWIKIEGTKINYPVVQGSDNDFYLNHMVNKKQNAAGSIFWDYENKTDFSDVNTILYGHHMKNGSMFAGLQSYDSQDYYEVHPTGMLVLPNQKYEIHFVAAYVANVNDNAWQMDFSDQASIDKWINSAIKKSTFKSHYSVKPGDHFVTLSTCSYEFDDARYILVGVVKTV